MPLNPQLSRRPAVDASIVQADTVRGYDAPNASETEADLIISNGRNAGTGAVADILIWNRTDLVTQPMFVLAPGSVLASSTKFEVYAGAAVDPNGVITSPIGSLYLSNNPAALWQNQDGGTVWKKISDDLGGENLAQTLAIGNTSGSNNIIMSKTPGGPLASAAILGESVADGTNGGSLLLGGGEATGVTGNGGQVIISSGSSLNANSGSVIMASFPASAASAASGQVSILTGDSALGPSGDMIIGTGNANGDVGDILLATGASATGNGGNIAIGAFGGPLSGGSVLIAAGNPTGAGTVAGGQVTITSGNATGAGGGGNLFITAGNSGPSGGVGGDVILTAGTAVNPVNNGQIRGIGTFVATNYRRGASDPNTLGLSPVDEGHVFQDSRAGNGALWVNTNGSPVGWKKLAFAADFVNSFARLSYGTCTPSGDRTNPSDVQDDLSDFGLFEGAEILEFAGGVQSRTVDEYGPLNLFSTSLPGQGAGWRIINTAAGNTSGFQKRQRFLAVFKLSLPQDINTQRVVVGFSSEDLQTHLLNNNPGGEYVLVQIPLSNTWRVFTQGPGGSLAQGLPSTVFAGLDVPLYCVFDFTDPTTIKVQMLDEGFNLIQERTLTGANLGFGPQDATNLFPIFGIYQDAVGPSLGLKFYSANVIVEADQILSAAGLSSNPTLEQVLIAGNTTGATPIIFEPGSFITTSDGTSGTNLSITTGDPTDPAGNSGSVSIFSSNITDLANVGSSGDVSIQTGQHIGLGGSGSIVLRTGQVTTPGQQTGSIQIRVGQFPTTGVFPGQLNLNGQDVVGAGDSGGDVTIDAGGYVGALAGNGGSLFLRGGQNTGPGPVGGVNITTPGAALGTGGPIFIGTGVAALGSGGVTIESGDSTGPGSTSGKIDIIGGNAPVGTGGAIALTTGNGLTGGQIDVTAGVSSSANGPNVTVTAGDSLVALGVGGSIVLNPGNGPGGAGEVLINGKLSVTGLIDPTGLVLDAQGVVPYAPPIGQGLLWVNSATDELFFTNSSGTTNISATAPATSLATLSDVTLGVLNPGDVLTYNGAFWINVPGGGSPDDLATVLATGNATGANSILIENSLGSSLTSDGDLVINPGSNPGEQIVLDGLRWPQVDGLAGEVLTTDGAGNLSFAPGGGTPPLSSVLLTGNVTSGSDVVLTGGSVLRGADASPGGDATIRGGNGFAPGDNGGNLFLRGGNAVNPAFGGEVLLTSGDGDTAGNLTVQTGVSVSSPSVLQILANGATNGVGGLLDIKNGDAGDGAGGFMQIRGSNATGPTGGNGGGILTEAGDASQTGTGGFFTIRAGDGDIIGNGGAVTINSGAGGNSSGTGGLIDIQAGSRQTIVGAADFSGAVLLRGGGGNAATTHGGPVTIRGGDIGTPEVFLPGLPVAGVGGRIRIVGGAGATGDGGQVIVQGGIGGTTLTNNGGPVAINGGPARTLTNGNGGNLTLNGGNGQGTGNGGNITLTPGTGSPNGEIVLAGALNNNAAGVKFGTISQSAASVAYTYGVGALGAYTAFSSTPRFIQVSLEAQAAEITAGVQVYVLSGTISATGFTLNLSPTPVNPVTIHWEARL